MLRGDLTPSRYCTSCTGCQSSSGSHTNWQFWCTKFGACLLRFTYTAKSQNVPAAKLYFHLPSRCWTNCSWEQSSLGMLSSFQHHLSGTGCHKQFSSVILCLLLNPDLKQFFSIRLLVNTDSTCCQCLWSYDHIATDRNLIIIIIINLPDSAENRSCMTTLLPGSPPDWKPNSKFTIHEKNKVKWYNFNHIQSLSNILSVKTWIHSYGFDTISWVTGRWAYKKSFISTEQSPKILLWKIYGGPSLTQHNLQQSKVVVVVQHK